MTTYQHPALDNEAGTVPSACQRLPDVDGITELLRSWRDGDSKAGEEVIEQIYPLLRNFAGRELARGWADLSIQLTEVVHESYLRMAIKKQPEWNDRQHFYAICATIIRRVLVDQARRKRSSKRSARVLDLDSVQVRAPEPHPELVALHVALGELALVDSTAARIVDLRYFGGLGIDATANVLGVSRSTVVRKWRVARSWLRVALDVCGTG